MNDAENNKSETKKIYVKKENSESYNSIILVSHH